MDTVKSFRVVAVVSAVIGAATIQHWRLNTADPISRLSRGGIAEWNENLGERSGESAFASVTDPAVSNEMEKIGSKISSSIDETVLRAQSHAELYERFEAIADLGDSSAPQAESALVNLLHDPSREIREAALESLGALATRGAIVGLSYALSDSDELVRLLAVEILAGIGTPDAIYALAVTVDEQSPIVRMSAISELGELRNAAADAVLLQFLVDGDQRIRATAAEYLAISEPH